MTPYYQDDFVTLYNGKSEEVLKDFDPSVFTACVTDPPYGLAFMGKAWDYDVPKQDLWDQVYRVCKPGAHLLSFFGSRTYHRGVIPIEDAGFEIRDQIMWVYGSGFPKSHDIAKAIDKKEGQWRGRATGIISVNGSLERPNYHRSDKGEPISSKAKLWNGYGTALKPAHEPIVLARKPIDGTVARNALEHGCGGLNIDGGRIAGVPSYPTGERSNIGFKLSPHNTSYPTPHQFGRFPANFIHDGIDEDWAKFFYCAKAGKKERNEGCQALPETKDVELPKHNNHPTVKPLALMKYPVTLVKQPEHNLILEPFGGSGTTAVACKSLGLKCVIIEMSEDYCKIIAARVAATKFEAEQLQLLNPPPSVRWGRNSLMRKLGKEPSISSESSTH